MMEQMLNDMLDEMTLTARGIKNGKEVLAKAEKNPGEQDRAARLRKSIALAEERLDGMRSIVWIAVRAIPDGSFEWDCGQNKYVLYID